MVAAFAVEFGPKSVAVVVALAFVAVGPFDLELCWQIRRCLS